MKPVVILRHLDCEGPGYLATFLDRDNIPYRVVAIDKGESPPADVTDVGGLVLMGGPMSVNDPLSWIDQEVNLIREAHARGIPILGHCLGGQLIAKAFGATVQPNRSKEIGWYDIETIASPAAERWLNGLPQHFLGFHWHGETFGLPSGAIPLFRSELCQHQGFAVGNTLALQFHVEITAAMIVEWTERNTAELATRPPGVQTKSQMMEDVAERVEALHRVADALYSAWLRATRAG